MFYLGELQEDHHIEHGTSSGHGNNPARAELDRETRGAPSCHNPINRQQQKRKQQLIRSNQRQESNPTTNQTTHPSQTTNLLQSKPASNPTSTSIFRYNNSISNSTICENTATTNPNCTYIPAITNTNTNTNANTNTNTMPLSTILSKNSLLSYSSYGSIDTFSDYHDTADLPTFISPESGMEYGRTNNPTIRRIEVCRRHTISTVLLITIVVIIFGMTGEDPEEASTLSVSRLCQQFLILLAPESSSSSSPEEH